VLGLIIVLLVLFGVIYLIVSMLESSVKDLITLDFLKKLKNAEEEELKQLEKENEMWERVREILKEQAREEN